MRMASRYGHTWVRQYGASPAGIAAAEWRSTLAGLTVEHVRAGFRADTLRGSEWPPSSTSFLAMCRDIPMFAKVNSEVMKLLTQRKWLGGGREEIDVSRFSRLVWAKLDVYSFRNAQSKQAERMLKDAYGLACEHVIAGGELPDEPVALIEKQVTPIKPARPEVAKEHLERMRDILRESDPEDAA
jgi:hypothetical protein